MPTVHYITPYFAGDIGHGINKAIALLPSDDWVCIRDSDTLFLTSAAQRQIAEIADNDGFGFDIIGCRTNRLRSAWQNCGDQLFNSDSVSEHIEEARRREQAHWCEITEIPQSEVIAGMFMLMRVSLWHKLKFTRKSIYFDILYTNQARAAFGARCGIAQGIYLFHLYRYGQDDPFNYTEHLKK